MNGTFIYVLRDPRDGKAFYVGKSARLFKRFKAHCVCEKHRNPRRERMLLELKAQGFKPMLHILEKCFSDRWQDREKFWIAEYRRLGFDLCNAHIGGNGWPAGVRSRPCSEEKKRKLSEINKSRPLHPAFMATWGRKQSPQEIEKRAASNRGKKRTEDVKERTRQSNLRTWTNPELRERHKAFGATGERLKKLRDSRRKWWLSLSTEERSRRAKVASDAAKQSCGNKNWLMSLTPEERRLRALTASEAAKAVNRKERHASV